MKTKREEIQELSATEMVKNNYQGVYVIAPRVGKSKIVIDATNQVEDISNWNICLAVPRFVIVQSWASELGKWKARATTDVICFPSLKKIPEGLDLLVIDECHMLSVAQMMTIKKKKPKRLLLITGTANKYTRSKLKYQLGVDVVFEYSFEQAIADGIIANFCVYIVKTKLDETNVTSLVKTHKYSFYTTEKKNYDFYDSMFEELRLKARADYSLERVKMIAASKRANVLYHSSNKEKVARRVIEGVNEKTLIFTTRTDMADKLSKHTFHTKNKKEKNLTKFIEGEIDKLAAVNMTDMGVTIEDLKFEVIHQLQSNSEASLQKFLRAANLEEDRVARIVLIVCEDTVDEGWTKLALEGVPEHMITIVQESELDMYIENGFTDKQIGTNDNRSTVRSSLDNQV